MWPKASLLLEVLQIIFSGDQNFKEFIDYGSGSMGILLTLKKIIDNQEFDLIFKDL